MACRCTPLIDELIATLVKLSRWASLVMVFYVCLMCARCSSVARSKLKQLPITS
mgnify:CR=1